MKTALWVALALIASGCHGERAAVGTATDWRSVATPLDRARLNSWRATLVTALATARASGHGPAIDDEGAVLQPDSAMEDVALLPGSYHCRTIKLGARTADMSDFMVYPAGSCQVSEQGVLTQTDRPQRASGRVFPADRWHSIFLGTATYGDETRAMAYGRDTGRDMAGTVERIAPERWRIILPSPATQSMVDVVEITRPPRR